MLFSHIHQTPYMSFAWIFLVGAYLQMFCIALESRSKQYSCMDYGFTMFADTRQSFLLLCVCSSRNIIRGISLLECADTYEICLAISIMGWSGFCTCCLFSFLCFVYYAPLHAEMDLILGKTCTVKDVDPLSGPLHLKFLRKGSMWAGHLLRPST